MEEPGTYLLRLLTNLLLPYAYESLVCVSYKAQTKWEENITCGQENSVSNIITLWLKQHKILPKHVPLFWLGSSIISIWKQSLRWSRSLGGPTCSILQMDTPTSRGSLPRDSQHWPLAHWSKRGMCLELQAATSEASKRDECYASSPEGICWSTAWRNWPQYGHYTLPGHSLLSAWPSSPTFGGKL